MKLRYENGIIFYFVDNTMFVGDSPGPIPGEAVFEVFGFPYSLIRHPLRFFYWSFADRDIHSRDQILRGCHQSIDKPVEMIPLERMPPERLLKEVGITLGGLANGIGSVLAGVGRDGDGIGEGNVIIILAGAEGEENEEGGAGDQAEDEGGFGEIGVMAEEVDADLALVGAPDDVAGHGDQAA